jgi:ComF family protein
MSQGWHSLFPSVLGIDVIVPVPLHAKRERARGYNQAALLARELGSHLSLPVSEEILARVKATIPQVGLDIQQRQANVSAAFGCVRPDLAGRTVLLVDDVCTSGSTLEAAASALRDGGVSTVWAYTLTRARQ